MEKKVKQIFKDNKLSYDWEINSELPCVLLVYVEWGDWKHDHICLNNIMKQNGFHFIGEDVTEEDGSDTYSATHIFIGTID